MKLRCGVVIQIFLWKKLEEFLNTPDDSDVGYFNDVDLK